MRDIGGNVSVTSFLIVFHFFKVLCVNCPCGEKEEFGRRRREKGTAPALTTHDNTGNRPPLIPGSEPGSEPPGNNLLTEHHDLPCESED